MRAFALLAACAGCYGDVPSAPDARMAPDPGPALVTVRYVAPQPAPPARVLFQQRDSSIALATTTDGSGVARAPLRPDGFVTVIDATREAMFTYTGVQPGDTLVIGDPSTLRTEVTRVQLTVPPAATTLYGYELGCGATSATSPTALVEGFNCGDELTALVFDDADNFVVRTGVARSADDLAILVPGPYQPIGTVDIALANVSSAISVSYALAFGRVDARGTAQLAETATTLRFAGPVATGLVAKTQLIFDTSLVVLDWEPTAPLLSFDVAQLAPAPQLAPARWRPEASAVRWEDGSGPRPNYLLALLQVGPLDESGGPSLAWFVAGPRGAGDELALPVLPGLSPSDVRLSALSGLRVEGDAMAGVRERLGGFHPFGALWPTVVKHGRLIRHDYVLE